MTVTPELRDALIAREPILHRRELVHDGVSFDEHVAPGFWEWGASGARHDRATCRRLILERLRDLPEDLMTSQGWTFSGWEVTEVSPGAYLVTYTLHRPGQDSRRCSVWRRLPGGQLQIMFHQGTVVS